MENKLEDKLSVLSPEKLTERVADFALEIALPISRYTTPLYHVGMGLLKGASGMPLIPQEFGLVEAGAVGTVVHRNVHGMLEPESNLTPNQRVLSSRLEESGPVGDFIGGMVIESTYMAFLHTVAYVAGFVFRTGG